MSHCIYALIDPRTREIFYVGRTSDIERRCAEHFEGTRQLSGLTVRQIKEAGFLPHVTVLEQCTSRDASCMAEIYWIECLLSRGTRLANTQAFPGHVARKDEQRQQSEKLSSMRDIKSASQALADVSNGVPARSGEPWSRTEMKRLKGMARYDYSPEYIADELARPLSEVKAKLKTVRHRSRRSRRAA